MARRIPEPARPRKLVTAAALTEEHAWHPITIGDPAWPVRGELRAVRPGPGGQVLLVVHRRNGNDQEVMTAGTTPVLVHRKLEKQEPKRWT